MQAKNRKNVSELAVLCAAVFVLLALSAIPTYAWQLGGTTGAGDGSTGLRAAEQTVGTVPSPYFFAAVSAFTDTYNGGMWHALGDLTFNNPQSELEAEWAQNGTYHDFIMCSGLSQSVWTSYMMFVAVPGGTHAFVYHNANGVGCSDFYGPSEPAGTTIATSGQAALAMGESTDHNTNDFTNLKAATYLTSSDQYYSGACACGIWLTASSVSSYATTGSDVPPSTLGLGLSCGAKVYVASNQSPPPPVTGQINISC